MVNRTLTHSTLALIVLGSVSCLSPESTEIEAYHPEKDEVALFTEPYAHYVSTLDQYNDDQFLNLVVLPFMDEYWELMDSPNLIKAYFDRKPQSLESLSSMLDSINSNRSWLEDAVHELLDDYRQNLEVNRHFEVIILPSHHPGNGLVGNTSVIVDKNNYIIVFLDATSRQWRTEMLRYIAYQLVRDFVFEQAGGDMNVYSRLADLIILEGKSHFIANKLVPEAIPAITQYDAQYFADGVYPNQIKNDLNSTLGNVIAARFDRDWSRASWFGLHMMNQYASNHPEFGLRTFADASPDSIIRAYYSSLE